MNSHLVVSGIGTEVGKTVAAAIIAETLGMDYWKPVQAGELHDTDTDKVSRWISNGTNRVHPESFRLQTPASPHYAAAIDGVKIEINALKIPQTEGSLLIEGAGGLMVPLNDHIHYLDVFKQWNIPVVLVSRHYLGSINHTLLSIAALKAHHIPIAGVLFNGEENQATESIIKIQGQVPILGRISETETVDAAFIQKEAARLKPAVTRLIASLYGHKKRP